jgi:serine/threonine protein kinase
VTTAAAPPELPGYTFVRNLGSGGFADVHLYRQQKPAREVAVKVLRDDEADPASRELFREAFRAEANHIAQLSEHPFIIRIYDTGTTSDGREYFAMQYCPGPSLADLYRRQPFTVADALRTGIRLSSAVATAHAAGILHRDIKPANVLTNSYGWPILTDFGIASALEAEPAGHGTTRGAAIDTGSSTEQSFPMSIPWSAPEVHEELRTDFRTDVFSLAATIYTLLAGRTPFELPGQSSQNVLIARIVRGQITPMERTDVPAELLAALTRGMEVDPDDRFESAAAFGRALEAVELQQQLPRTDVPVLVDPVPYERADDSEPATRVRGVPTVQSQRSTKGKPSSPSPTSTPASLDPALERTRLRDEAAGAPALDSTLRRRDVAPPPEAPTDDEIAAPPAGAPRRPRPRWLASVLGVLGALAAIAIVITLVVVFAPDAGGSDDPALPTSGPEDQDPVIGSPVPVPVLESVAVGADGSVTFTWSNPSPEEGDSYVWERTDGASDDQRHPTTEPTATVTGVAAGTTVCIDVYVRRDGELSPEPLSECHP